MGSSRCQIHEGKETSSGVEGSGCENRHHVGADVGQHIGRIRGCEETKGCGIEGKWEEAAIALVPTKPLNVVISPLLGLLLNPVYQYPPNSLLPSTSDGVVQTPSAQASEDHQAHLTDPPTADW